MINYVIKNCKVVLLGILVLAFILRLISLDTILSGLQVDEGLIVYNAYSLAQTGHDALNYSYPIYFKAFGWGQSPIIIYILLPIAKIFGLDYLPAFRLVIIFFHLLIIFFAFLLVKKIFNEKYALLACFLLAISPWSLVLSRIIFSVNILPFFYLAGMYFLLVGLNNLKKYAFMLAGIFFALSLYTYDLSFLWLPLLALIIIICFKDEVRKMNWRNYLVFVLPMILIAMPIILFYLKNQLGLLPRLEHLWIFSLPTLDYTRFDAMSVLSLPFLDMIFKVFINYFSHLAPTFWFLDANLTIFPKYFGLYYLIEMPFIFWGIISCLKNYCQAKYKFLIWWLILAPLPAALTLGNIPHPLRFINALALGEIFMAIGLIEAFSQIKDIKKRTAWSWLLALFFAVNVGLYLVNFLTNYKATSFLAFGGTDKAISIYIQKNYDQYDKFVVLLKEPYNLNLMPYNYLVYSNYPPKKVQALSLLPDQGRIEIDKVIFEYNRNFQFQPAEKVMYFVSFLDKDFLADKKIVQEFKDLGQETIIYAVTE